MDDEKRSFFLKKNLVWEKSVDDRCWQFKLKIKNGRFWLEKKYFEILIEDFDANRPFPVASDRSRSSKHGFLRKYEPKSEPKKN